MCRCAFWGWCAGGRSLLSKDEVAEARAEAEEDFEREGKKGKGKRKRKVNESSGFGADDDLGTLFGGATTGKLPRFANRITVKVLPSETLLLCRNVIGLLIELQHRFVTLVTTHSTARLSGDQREIRKHRTSLILMSLSCNLPSKIQIYNLL